MRAFLIIFSGLWFIGVIGAYNEGEFSDGMAVFSAILLAVDIYYWLNRKKFAEKRKIKKRIKELEDARKWEERMQKIANTPRPRVNPEEIIRPRERKYMSASQKRGLSEGQKRGLALGVAGLVYFPIAVIMKLAKNYE